MIASLLLAGVLTVPGVDVPRDTCTSTWLRLPNPGELTYTNLSPWEAYLIAEGQQPESLSYVGIQTDGKPVTWKSHAMIAPGPQEQGRVVVVMVGGNCECGICYAVTFRIIATSSEFPYECSEVTIAFPLTHECLVE